MTTLTAQQTQKIAAVHLVASIALVVAGALFGGF